MARKLLPVAFLLLLAFGCKTAAVYNVDGASLGSGGLSLAEVETRIDRAARMQDWDTEKTGPGTMIVTKKRGRHAASATLRYDTQTFSIRLRNSIDLRESGDGTSIHKLYNVWVQRLEDSIVSEATAPN